MLTDAQYKALKAWPDISIQYELEKLDIIRPITDPLNGRIVGMDICYPICDQAIREYEEAQKSLEPVDIDAIIARVKRNGPTLNAKISAILTKAVLDKA